MPNHLGLNDIKAQIEGRNPNIIVTDLDRRESEDGVITISTLWITFKPDICITSIKEICSMISVRHDINMVVFRILRSPHVFYIHGKNAFFAFDKAPKTKTIEGLYEYIEQYRVIDENGVLLLMQQLQKGAEDCEDTGVSKGKGV